MRLYSRLVMVLVMTAPLAAWGQEGGEEEFYEDPDAASEASGEASAEAEDSAAEEEAAGGELPFRGSAFVYENIFSVGTANDLSSEATFSYAMSYSLRPRYYLNDWFNFRLRLDLEQELTDSSSTTRRREPLLSDLWLDFYFSDVLETVTDAIDLNAYLRLQFPTSKTSQANTMVMGGTLGTVVRYTAPVLEGLRLTYGIDFTKYFHQRTTPSYEEPLIQLSPTPNTQALFESYQGPGSRNSSWRMRNTISAALMPIENLTLSVTVLFYDYFLYPVADVTTDDLGVDVTCDEPDGCAVDQDPNNTDRSSSIWYLIEIAYNPVSWLGLALGTSTYNPQLTPGSDYRAPFFNRFTNIYFDITLSIDALVNAIRHRGQGDSEVRWTVDEV